MGQASYRLLYPAIYSYGGDLVGGEIPSLNRTNALRLFQRKGRWIYSEADLFGRLGCLRTKPPHASRQPTLLYPTAILRPCGCKGREISRNKKALPQKNPRKGRFFNGRSCNGRNNTNNNASSCAYGALFCIHTQRRTKGCSYWSFRSICSPS